MNVGQWGAALSLIGITLVILAAALDQKTSSKVNSAGGMLGVLMFILGFVMLLGYGIGLHLSMDVSVSP